MTLVRSKHRYDSIDLWRGIACLSVLVFHVVGFRPEGNTSLLWGVIERLWVGVPLFFVISGYCIAASAERVRNKGSDLRSYFARRLTRIYPPAWVMIALGALAVNVFPVLFTTPHGGFLGIQMIDLSGWNLLGQLTLTQGWRAHMVGEPPLRWFLSPFWTLGYEEQFYVVVGILLLLDSGRWFVSAALLSLAVVFISQTRSAESLVGLFVDGHWLIFALGLGAFWHLHRALGWQRKVIPLACVIVFVWAASMPKLWYRDVNLAMELFIASGFTVLMIGLHPFDRTFSAMRWLQPLRWCGIRCYSIYLLHWPIAFACAVITERHYEHRLGPLLVIALPSALLATLSAAAVFFAVIERPCISAMKTQTSLNRKADAEVAA